MSDLLLTGLLAAAVLALGFQLGRRRRWLLGEICRQNAAWCRRGLPRRPVSVNVSVRQFQAGDLEAVIESALAEHRLEPGLLHVEITESIAMRDIERADEVLWRLAEMGIKIQLDDFGTGYSSLGYLLDHPVDILKIDRSFIADAPASHHGAAIVRATLALARSLDLTVIAEGVETPAQLEFLRREGCTAAQGYLFGFPLPAEEHEAVLRAGRVPLPAPAGSASGAAPGSGGEPER